MTIVNDVHQVTCILIGFWSSKLFYLYVLTSFSYPFNQSIVSWLGMPQLAAPFRVRNTKKNMACQACHFCILLAGLISYGLPSMYFLLPSLKFGLPFCHWQGAISSLACLCIIGLLSCDVFTGPSTQKDR
jgi:hypothetical protein